MLKWKEEEAKDEMDPEVQRLVTLATVLLVVSESPFFKAGSETSISRSPELPYKKGISSVFVGG